MSSSLKDRTGEFKSCVESSRLRNASSSEVRRPLIPKTANGQTSSNRSEMARMAGKIASDIQGTTLKLEKLAQLAKRKTLFDDRPVEISELTYIIKQDIAQLNQQIAQLQSFTKSHLQSNGGSGGKQVTEHNNNVVMMLQSKLADTSIGFKDVLEIRTQNMKASRDRTEQFMYTGQPQASTPASVLRARNSSVSRPPSSYTSDTTLRSDSPLYRSGGTNGKGKGRETTGQPADFMLLDMGTATQEGSGAAQEGYMQQQLVEGQDTYLTQRGSAIETIESTIAELGSIFSQLATMVAQQGDMVTRIDTDTDEIATNVGGAQRELLKYYASVSSNRWLMIKVFGILIAFFLLFILVS